MYAIRKVATDLYFCGFSEAWPNKMQFIKMADGYICVFQTHEQAKEYVNFAFERKWTCFPLEVAEI